MKKRVVDGVAAGIQSAMTAYSKEYFGQRLIETRLDEILLAEGQLKLCLALTIFNREYFGQRRNESELKLLNLHSTLKPLPENFFKCVGGDVVE